MFARFSRKELGALDVNIHHFAPALEIVILCFDTVDDPGGCNEDVAFAKSLAICAQVSLTSDSLIALQP